MKPSADVLEACRPPALEPADIRQLTYRDVAYAALASGAVPVIVLPPGNAHGCDDLQSWVGWNPTRDALGRSMNGWSE